NIHFQNTMKQTLDFNFINYPYIFTGGGVAVGDIDNDGLEDIYFVSNFGPNKLYLNQGDFQFEDITKAANTEDYQGFSTGVSMLDVNSDGYLDIYVCKAGSLDNDEGRRNLLFINNQNSTFTEAARQWGLDDPGYATQAYPIDYDKDGDLDIYLVNYRYDFKNNTKLSGEIQRQIEETTSDQLYRNDGARFTKVTGEAGVYNKTWGLGAAIGDFNNDGWDDIYVANDFLEPDFLYINQQDGTFKNEINSRFNHISFNSMGADLADINNDLAPDLVTVDMLAENYARGKENMASMSTSNFLAMVDVGYHHAYMANMLQLNNGNGKFKEIGQSSGMVKTDWSWAPLLADFDNDGHKDLFITNGVYKDYANQDFRNKVKKLSGDKVSLTLEEAINLLPSEKLSNYMFQNDKNLGFKKVTKDWGLDHPTFSNGAAYADLDNDGDLDLVINNIDDAAGIYKNNSANNFVQVKLRGTQKNPLGIGSKVYVKSKGKWQVQEVRLARGFESSVTPKLTFGLHDTDQVEEIAVLWNDGKVSEVKNPSANREITVSHSSAKTASLNIPSTQRKKQPANATSLGLTYAHKENTFNDYSLQLLLPQKQSSKGTAITTADVNSDGLDDFFVGNAAGAAAALYVQKSDGTFLETNQRLWQNEAKFEDANAQFFDADGDGDQDLYVVSAGYELNENDPRLQDRLYLNNGRGEYAKSTGALPTLLVSGKALAISDYDGDGDLDIFVGGNVVTKKYPLPPSSHLLENTNGTFTDVTDNHPELKDVGMVSEALFTDYDNDSNIDLVMVGEWMAPTFFQNKMGRFTKTEVGGLEKTEGWWFSMAAADFDGDGDQDFVFGNVGGNNKFQPKKDKPLYIYAKDFDNNGSFDVALSKINDGRQVPVRGKECSSEQNPFLLDKIETYKEFASLEMKDIYGEDKLKDAYRLTAHMFESVYAENMGNGTFKISKLPMEAQLGPTMAFTINDINNDGNLDILGVGAIYDAEVETIRYDANFGYVLLGNGHGKFTHSNLHDPFVDSDAKDIATISIQNKKHYMVVSNNAPLQVFSYTP
ncbi:MAG: RNA-binding protein, partial [Flavobacteriaceae bacterium]|nr:RNA-binding protein [Flavobacteriaceae bacterium]